MLIFSDDHLRLQTGSEFNAIWVENNYTDVMLQQAATIVGKPIKISLLTNAAEATDARPEVQTSPNRRRTQSHAETLSRCSTAELDLTAKRIPNGRAQINERNTFSSFVVGAGNQLAHAAQLLWPMLQDVPTIRFFCLVIQDWVKRI